MSINVSGGVVVNLLQNGDNLNTSLNATAPLYQTFKKGTADYTPDWSTMPDDDRPIIYPRVYSTMQAEVLSISNIIWEYNGVTMEFDSSGICDYPEVAAGKVKQVTHDGVKALKLIGNLASDVNNDSDIVSFSGDVFASGQHLNVSAEATILIEEASANLYRLFLNMTDDVIDGDEESLTIVADLRNMGAAVTKGVEFEFLDAAGKVLRAKDPEATFVVTRKMIDSELMIIAKAYVNGKIVAQQQRQVWDSTDPFVITCDQGSNVMQSGRDDLIYSFTLLNARTGTVMTNIDFTIKVYRTRDNEDITSQFSKTTTSITIAGVKMIEHKSLYLAVSCIV